MVRPFPIVAAFAALTLTACAKSQPVVAPQTPAPQREVIPTPPPVDHDAERRRREAEEAARRDAERIRTVMAEHIYFDYDRADIRSDMRAVLDRKVEILRANPALTVRIEGHADDRGSDEYNLALGQRRASAARLYLVSQGINIGRLHVASWGEERPLDPRKTEAAWSRNRRDEFVIVEGSPVAARE